VVAALIGDVKLASGFWLRTTASKLWRVASGNAATRPFISTPLEIGAASTGPDVEAAYPLTPLQHSMLIQSLDMQRFGVDIEQIVIGLREDVNVPALREAWRHAVERHPILRTVFLWNDVEGPRQHVQRRIAIPWTEVNWRGLSVTERKRRYDACLLADRARCFNLSVEPPFRLTLIHEESALHRLIWTFHHIAADGRGTVALLQEVFARYEANICDVRASLEPVVPFGEFVAWQQRRDSTRDEAYWREALRGFVAPTRLAVMSTPPRTLDPAEMRGEQGVELSASVTTALKEIAQANRLNTNMLVQGAWALLLSRYSGEEDVVYGAIRACRRSTVPGAKGIVGMCINTVPVRVRVPANQMLLPWLKELRDQWISLRKYEHTPLIMIQGWSDVPRGMVIFETLVNLQDPSWDAALHSLGGKWSERELSIISQPSVPLVLDGYGGAQIKLILLYDRRRFDDAAVARMLGHLQTLLEGIAADPQRRLVELPMITEQESQRVVVEFNRTKTKYPRQFAVHRLFEQQAKSTPNAIALLFEGETLTYRDLNRRANQLAHYLHAHGVREGTMVGICVERSLEMVVGVLGILKAGGAYVPLDPTYPRDRLAYMLKDTNAPILLTQAKLRGNLPKSQADILCLDRDWSSVVGESVENLPGKTDGNSLAYVIYTSGSTGQPKGACVSHRGIVRLVKNTNYVRLDAKQVFLQFAPISFDASTFELWGCLLNGGRLVIFPPAKPSLQQLGEVIEKQHVTILWLTAALFHHMVENCCDKLKGVRQLLAGGDVLPIGTVREALMELKNTRLINGYGPTENTTFTCCHDIGAWFKDQATAAAASSVPIGRPIANTTAYILDRHLQPVPIGVPGELWTGGDGLATCYLNHPEMTAECFRPDPFSSEPGARMYHTGDLVRWLPDGTIEFLGRIDQQVKIRGFRIELGEIETVLAQHPAVSDVCVIAREDTPGDKRLVAYVVLKPEAERVIDHPRQLVKQRLPEYMVPSAVVVMDALPLSPAGKVDRRNLPKPERVETEASAGFVAARTLTEEVAIGIWEDVLKVDRVGVNDNFFELGGDSLLATVTAVRLGRALNIELPVTLVFDEPTLGELCAAADLLLAGTPGDLRPPVTPLPRDRALPLSFFQQRIWEFSRAAPDPLQFRAFFSLDLTGPLDVDLFCRSVTEVIRRHEVLRTTISMEQGEPVQVVHAPTPVSSVTVIDVCDDGHPERVMDEEAKTPIDLVHGPLMRIKLMRISATRHFLMLTFHHLLYDGSLREIFLDELSALYRAFRLGEASPLPELAVQYGDFAAWQRQHLDSSGRVYQKQIAYWRKQLAGAPPGIELPFARSKPAIQNLVDARMPLLDWFPAELCRRLEVFSHREGATLFMTLLAGFKICLHQATGQEDLVVGTYISSRGQPEMDRVIGLKTNLVALRTSLTGRPTFREVLRRVRTTTLDAYANQDVLYHQVEAALTAVGSPAPKVEAIFQHVGMPTNWLSLPDIEVEHLLKPAAQAMPWGFTFNLVQNKDHIRAGVSFDTDRYDPEGVRRMTKTYIELLNAMIADPDDCIESLKAS